AAIERGHEKCPARGIGGEPVPVRENHRNTRSQTAVHVQHGERCALARNNSPRQQQHPGPGSRRHWLLGTSPVRKHAGNEAGKKERGVATAHEHEWNCRTSRRRKRTTDQLQESRAIHLLARRGISLGMSGPFEKKQWSAELQ